MFDLDAEREYIKKLGTNVRAICKYVDKWQDFGDRLCPCAIYQDDIAKKICRLPQTAICRPRYATCFKMYHEELRKQAAAQAAENPPTSDEAPATVWYVCDRTKCGDKCSDECKHTSDITHAANFTAAEIDGKPAFIENTTEGGGND